MKSVLCQDVGKLVLGVNIFDLDFGVQVDSVKQPMKLDTVGTGHMSHCRTSAFENHLDYCFVVFKNERQGAEVRRFGVCGNVVHIESINIISVEVCLRSGVGACS